MVEEIIELSAKNLIGTFVLSAMCCIFSIKYLFENFQIKKFKKNFYF